MAIHLKISPRWGPHRQGIQECCEDDYQGIRKRLCSRGPCPGLRSITSRNSPRPFYWYTGRLSTGYSWMGSKLGVWVELDGHYIWRYLDLPVRLFYLIPIKQLNWLQCRSKVNTGNRRSKWARAPTDPAARKETTTTAEGEAGPSSPPNKPTGKKGRFDKPQTAKWGTWRGRSGQGGK